MHVAGPPNLRREATPIRAAAGPTSSRASAWCRVTGSASRRFRSPRPARAGSTTSASTCATTCATPRSRSRAASTSCRCSPAESSRTTCAATGRCGRCGSGGPRPRPLRDPLETHHALVDGVSGLDILSVLSRPTRRVRAVAARACASPPGWCPRRCLSARRTPASSSPASRRHATPANGRLPHRGVRRRRRRAGLGGRATGAADSLQRQPGRPRPAPHMDARLARRHEGDQEHARRDGQRCRADSGHARAAPAPDAARRGHRRSRAESLRTGERAH